MRLTTAQKETQKAAEALMFARKVFKTLENCDSFFSDDTFSVSSIQGHAARKGAILFLTDITENGRDDFHEDPKVTVRTCVDDELNVTTFINTRNIPSNFSVEKAYLLTKMLEKSASVASAIEMNWGTKEVA